MSNLITFPRLKIGEIVHLDIDGTISPFKVLSRTGKNTYRLKALQGPQKGTVAYFTVTSVEGAKTKT